MAARTRRRLVDVEPVPGKPSARGEYRLADEAYAALLDRLTERRSVAVSPALRQNINTFYATQPHQKWSRKERKSAAKIEERLAALNSR